MVPSTDVLQIEPRMSQFYADQLKPGGCDALCYDRDLVLFFAIYIQWLVFAVFGDQLWRSRSLVYFASTVVTTGSPLVALLPYN